jgi:DNA-binding CsgD family transcriptional regulator
LNNLHNKSHLVSISEDSSLVVALEEFLQKYQAQKSSREIPLSLFSNRKLGVLEIVVKYLKENNNMQNIEIAQILNRNEKTISSTYSKAIRKHKELFYVKKDVMIDVSIFNNRKLAPLQALILSLKDNGKNLVQISVILNRSYKTIWNTAKK